MTVILRRSLLPILNSGNGNDDDDDDDDVRSALTCQSAYRNNYHLLYKLLACLLPSLSLIASH